MLRGQPFVEHQFWDDALERRDLVLVDERLQGVDGEFTFRLSFDSTDTFLIGVTAKKTDFGFEGISYSNLSGEMLPLSDMWQILPGQSPTPPHYGNNEILRYKGSNSDDLIAVRPEFSVTGGGGSDTFVIRDIGELDILDFTLNDTIEFDLGVLPQGSSVNDILPFVTETAWIDYDGDVDAAGTDDFYVEFGDIGSITLHDVTPEIVEVGVLALNNVAVWS